MSVIIRDLNTKKITLLTKGADTMMMTLITSGKNTEVQKELNEFAVEGLRTLVMASREIPENEFQDWHSKWKTIQLSKSKSKDEELDSQGAMIEKNLSLVGTSAIEDKLQQGVPEAIQLLMDSNIRVWVLTGDKEETAIEIAKSCNLLLPNMDAPELFCNSFEETREKLVDLLDKYNIDNSLPIETLEDVKRNLKKPIGLVINGITLTYVLSNPELSLMFFKIGFISNSCICCRVSPSQKMLVVRLSKTYGK